MAIQQDNVKYSQYEPQGLKRTTFGKFTDAGMNLFPSAVNMTPNDFMDLTNVLPSTSGGFRRRWGLNTMFTDSSGAFSPVRTFFYNVPLNSPLTAQEDLIITTDNQTFRVASVTAGTAATPLTNTLAFATFSGHGPSNFAAPGNVGAVTSRNWFYYANGINQPKKVCPGFLSANTDTNWGIVSPFAIDGSNNPTITAFGGTGQGYTSTPTVTLVNGGGTGATATAVRNTNGAITSFTVTNPGSGYTSNPDVTISGGGGSNAAAVAVYNDLGAITAVLPAGNIHLNSGRIYTYAYQNSFTGHTSDIANGIVSGGSRTPYLSTTATVVGPGVGVIGNVPANAGFQQIYITITPVNGVDLQVDGLILLATADGGTLQQLYQVGAGPVSVTPPNPGTITFTDDTPDTYSDGFTTGITLLSQNLWVSTDGSGNTFGITNNTPPPSGLLYPTLHQGRLFATDGVNLFFSKSLTEVTTATGLITSKWEEAWPGTNAIPIALNNETIVGLKSNGTTLHIATPKSIYELQGSDPSSFSIPNSLFQQTGLLTNDLWTVVYSQGQPAGYAWITPDLKMIYSDFNTYNDVSLPVYPLLSEWTNSFTQHAKLTSFSWGPYNFVAVCFSTTTGLGSGSFFLLFETVLQKWFRWIVTPTSSGPLNSFVYQHPETGYRGLFMQETSGSSLFYRLFDPAFTTDGGTGGNVINWSVMTSYDSLNDALAVKTVNEVEIISDETALQLNMYGGSTQSVLDTIPPNSLSQAFIGSKTAVLSPLGTRKTYWAGVPSNERYFAFNFFSNLTGTANSSPSEVLSHFIVEHFPMVRF